MDLDAPVASPTSPTQGLVTASPAPQPAAAPAPPQLGSVQDQVRSSGVWWSAITPAIAGFGL